LRISGFENLRISGFEDLDARQILKSLLLESSNPQILKFSNSQIPRFLDILAEAPGGK
jgi:hypothetical protein